MACMADPHRCSSSCAPLTSRKLAMHIMARPTASCLLLQCTAAQGGRQPGAAMAPKDRVPLVSAGLAVASLLLLLLCATRCEARAMAATARRLSSSSSSPLLNALFKLNFIRTVEPARRIPTAGDEEAASDINSPFCVNPPDAPSATTPPFKPFTPSFPGQAPQLPPITPVPPSFEPSPPAPENGASGGGQGGGQGQGGDQGQGGGGDQGQGGGQSQGGDQGQGGGGGDQGQGGGQSQGGDQGQGGGQGQGGSQGQGGGGGDQGQEGPPASTTPNSPPQVGPGGIPFGSVPPSPIVVVPSPPGSGPDPGSGLGGGGSGSDGGPFQPPIIYPPPLAPPLPPGAGQTLWCVAKPTVPDPIIQEAMDYACGAGAGCDSILPSGSCYRPNTVLAHASFAFNSYWQQAKATGGTCDFGGTATIVTRDPSYEECKFDLM
ncbi:translation initiation factor IF-2-like [Zea mays]|uniref:Carbohydrate-binding X8 domain superfamily protein n=2 Tax=Zea mays TaxID=4577 RepID=K7U6M3_MAIZE|nr:uncharacterized protein LOC100192797 isoform X1 [Zea mays]XP_035819799.1 translation initiation factor IF-2-like [Zea mays]AQK46056.1 Carbohydrate-binding X8 domain superfamily protein [Zea mays]|eukprot:XP_020400455.1 uncharacterized protein LOC100192797 isoform X1 [Zea mays]